MNILVYNPKGGAAKSTNSTLLASFLTNCKLTEVDKINQSANHINSRDYYEVEQLDFKNEFDTEFLKFIDGLIDKKHINIIDVGSLMLEKFHDALKNSDNYDLIDLIIIPAMDGSDDLRTAINYLGTLKENTNFDTSKVLISFNRRNEFAYSLEDQFDAFFDNQDLFKEFGINLQESYYVLDDSYAIKKSKKAKETLRYFAELDDSKLKEKSRDDKASSEDRAKAVQERTLATNARNFYENCIGNMIRVVSTKLENKKKK